jgi:hypothetical protein
LSVAGLSQKRDVALIKLIVKSWRTREILETTAGSRSVNC